MEIGVLVLLCVCLAGLALWQWIRCLRIRREVYDYAETLDNALNTLLVGETLEATVSKDDDLWGHTHERLVRLSQAVARERAVLQNEQRALQALVADISHQTKTPLANIKLYLERLKDTGDDPELVAKLSAQVEKLDFLLASMVKISRLETGAIRIEKRPQALALTLADALSVIVPKAEAKNIDLYVDYDDTIYLDHDRRWTAEALANLLDNAVKYTSMGGSVAIRVEHQPMFTAIVVRDNGKGIDRERQGAIFTRFYREPEVHDTEGAGLGLYLSRMLIERQGGYIEVVSEPGRGSIFTVYLPN